jgi:hypothetical protein
MAPSTSELALDAGVAVAAATDTLEPAEPCDTFSVGAGTLHAASTAAVARMARIAEGYRTARVNAKPEKARPCPYA